MYQYTVTFPDCNPYVYILSFKMQYNCFCSINSKNAINVFIYCHIPRMRFTCFYSAICVFINCPNIPIIQLVQTVTSPSISQLKKKTERTFYHVVTACRAQHMRLWLTFHNWRSNIKYGHYIACPYENFPIYHAQFLNKCSTCGDGFT